MRRRLAVAIVTLAAALSSGVSAAAENSHERLRTSWLRVQAYTGLGQWQAAIDELQRVLEARPQDEQALAELANAHLQMGEREKAIGIYRRLVVDHPERPAYRSDLAYLLSDSGYHDEVVRLLEHFFDRPTEVDHALLQLLASACDASGQTERADRMYAELLRRDPDNVDYLLIAGERLLARGQRAPARSHFERAFALQPRHPRTRKGLALSLDDRSGERYRALLLPVLVLDRADGEVPHWMGDLLYATDRDKALKYYAESLRRLERRQGADNYSQLLRARALYRLERRESAQALFDSLLAATPDVGLRNEIADLFVDDGRDDEALALIPPGTGDTRSARLRSLIYLKRGDWPRTAAELTAVAAVDSTDEELELSLAEALWRAGAWREALAIEEKVLFQPGYAPATAERALELRRELHRLRGSRAALEMRHVGLTGESTWGLAPSLRWAIDEDLAAAVELSGVNYSDDARPGAADFSAGVAGVGLAVTYAVDRRWDVTVHGRTHGAHADSRAGWGLQSTATIFGSARTEAEVSFNNLWQEPVDAVAEHGFFDVGSLALSMPVGKWFVQGRGSRRRLHLRGDRFGDETRTALFVGREIRRWAYGSTSPLRSLSVSLAHEHTWSEQVAAFEPLIDLPAETGLNTVGLNLYLLVAGRTQVSLSPFLGWDPERDLSFGDVYGLTAVAHADLTRRFAIEGEGFLATESSLLAAGGTYRTARLALLCYY